MPRSARPQSNGGIPRRVRTMRGLHCVTPETQTTSHYLWTVASTRPPDRPSNLDAVYKQTAATFDEDKLVIEAQYANMVRFADRPMLDIHVDTAPLRARRIIARLIRQEQVTDS